MIERVVSFALIKPLFVVLGLILFVPAASRPSGPCRSSVSRRDRHAGQHHNALPGSRGGGVEKQVTVPLEVVLRPANAVRLFSHTQFGLLIIIITSTIAPNAYFAPAGGGGAARGGSSRRGAAALAPPVDPMAKSTAIDSSPTPECEDLRSIEDWTSSGPKKKKTGALSRV